MNQTEWHLNVATPALLRHARNTYGSAMRKALEAAGYDDLPRNGLYVIGGMAREGDGVPLGQLIAELRTSKQAAGQLVDALVERGYLDRQVDPGDRRRLNVSLTEHGRAAAGVQAAARETVDRALEAQVGAETVAAMRQGLAALIDIGRETGAADAGGAD